jgi:hypothetical protein
MQGLRLALFCPVHHQETRHGESPLAFLERVDILRIVKTRKPPQNLTLIVELLNELRLKTF